MRMFALSQPLPLGLVYDPNMKMNYFKRDGERLE